MFAHLSHKLAFNAVETGVHLESGFSGAADDFIATGGAQEQEAELG